MNKTPGFLFADIAGLTLTPEDKEILAHPFISGVILFSRNYESIDQLRALTHQIAAVSPDIVITVDQEGGRVQRFRTGFTDLPSMGHWGAAYAMDAQKTQHDFACMLQRMVEELRDVGVYSTLVPVMDINFDRNTVIGHRSFGDNAEIVTALSAFMIAQFHALRSPVTGKHFPGHGFVTLDSHFALPVDERSFDEILQHDLQPFSQLSAVLDAIMLAHVVYTQVDPLPVCFSSHWIRAVLRQQLHFDGLILCDDLSMQAVASMGSYDERASAALAAGCDIVLACNDRAGVITILDHVLPKKSDDLARRFHHYCRFK
jgi:beta-N-acetylhexosaminidase